MESPGVELALAPLDEQPGLGLEGSLALDDRLGHVERSAHRSFGLRPEEVLSAQRGSCVPEPLRGALRVLEELIGGLPRVRLVERRDRARHSIGDVHALERPDLVLAAELPVEEAAGNEAEARVFQLGIGALVEAGEDASLVVRGSAREARERQSMVVARAPRDDRETTPGDLIVANLSLRVDGGAVRERVLRLRGIQEEAEPSEDRVLDDGELPAVREGARRAELAKRAEGDRAPGDDVDAVVRRRHAPVRRHGAVDALARGPDLLVGDGAPVGLGHAAHQTVFREVGRERALSAVDPEKIRRAPRVGEPVLEGGYGVCADRGGGGDLECLGGLAGVDGHRAAREVTGHVGGEGLEDRDVRQDEGREEIERNGLAIGLWARERTAVQEGVRVPLSEAAHVDELAVEDGGADHSFGRLRRVAIGGLRDVLGADGVSDVGGVLANEDLRRGAGAVRSDLDLDDLLGGSLGVEGDIEVDELALRDDDALDLSCLVSLVEDAELVGAGRQLDAVVAVEVGERAELRPDDGDLRLDDALAVRRLDDGARDHALVGGDRLRRSLLDVDHLGVALLHVHVGRRGRGRRCRSGSRRGSGSWGGALCEGAGRAHEGRAEHEEGSPRSAADERGRHSVFSVRILIVRAPPVRAMSITSAATP